MIDPSLQEIASLAAEIRATWCDSKGVIIERECAPKRHHLHGPGSCIKFPLTGVYGPPIRTCKADDIFGRYDPTYKTDEAADTLYQTAIRRMEDAT